MSSTNKLANTTFAAGVNDKLAVADKLTTKAGVKINSIQETSHKAGEVLANLIKGVSGDVGNVLQEVKGKIQVDSSALMSRLFANENSIKSAFAGLPSISRENILSKLDSDGELRATVDGIASQVKAAEFDRISGLSNIGKKVSGGDFLSISDTKSKAALISGLVKEANQLGIKGSINSFVDGLTGDDKNSIVGQVLKTSLPDLIKYGDTQSIQGLVNASLSKSLSGLRPGVAKQIAKAFKLNLRSDGTLDIAGSYDALLEILNLTQSGWNTFVREGGDDVGYRLSNVLTGNKDHVRTFQEGGRKKGTGNHKFHAMVGIIKPRTVADDVRRHFSSVIPLTAEVMKKNSAGNMRKDRTKDPIVTKALVGLGLIGTLLLNDD